MDAQSDGQTLSALRLRQAAIAEDIRQTEQRLYDLRQSYAALTATIRLFDPDARLYARPRRGYKRAWLFGGGKLSRLVLDVLRTSQRPLTTLEIATAIAAALGHGEAVASAIEIRLRTTLGYLARKRGIIVSEGERHERRWSLRC